jgi:hypothetical protein
MKAGAIRMTIKKKNLIAYSFLFFTLYFYHLVVTIAPGDDVIFSKASDQYSLLEWLSHRYNEWSGRLFPDTMVYILLDEWVWIWYFINPLMMFLLSYGMIRIFKKDVQLHEHILSLLIFGYFAQNVLSAGFFWITGSMNYSWPIALGLYSMIPFADKVFRKDAEIKHWKFVLYLLSGVLASIGNEQTALCISCFALLSLFYLKIKREKTNRKLILLSLLLIICTCVQLFAPGNEVRYVKNTEFWYPGFDQLTLKDHFYIGTIWAYEKLFRDMKYILLLLSTVIVFSQYKKEKTDQSRIFILFTLQFISVIGFHIAGEKLNFLYDFTAIKNYSITEGLLTIWKMPAGFVYALFPYLFWTLYSLLLAYLLFHNAKHKYFVLYALLATIATLIVMFFSPTIYGSGNRVLSAPSVILGILTINVMLENQSTNRIVTLLLIGCFSIVNLTSMFLKWHLNGFNPFL